MGREYQADEYKYSSKVYRANYKACRYYEPWKEVMSLITSKQDRLLELGCGPGQFAQMLYDNGFAHYTGVDFSPNTKPFWDKLKTGDYTFKRSNLYDVLNFCEYDDYDVVVCCEVLEHLAHDLEVLEKIAPGKRVIFTVPDFDDDSHLRHFHNEKEVYDRYKNSIDIHEIKTRGNLYVVFGTKSNNTIIFGTNLSKEVGVVLCCNSIDIKDGKRIPQTGKIIIGDGVSIGANTTIARGSNFLSPTVIRNNVNIAPLVLIGHGCRIGENVMIHGGANIAGYVEIGKGARIGMGAKIKNRVKIGAGAMVGIGAVVIEDVPAGMIVKNEDKATPYKKVSEWIDSK